MNSAVEHLAMLLRKLPGVGFKRAREMAEFMLKQPSSYRKELIDAIESLEQVRLCKECFYYAEPGNDLCYICSDDDRDRSVICVVEDTESVDKIEETGTYNGLYHVLWSVVDMKKGIMPDPEKVDKLMDRLSKDDVREVILAMSATTEGEITAEYIAQEIRNRGIDVKITTLARGISVGTEINFASPETLARALEGRVELQDDKDY